MFIWASMYLGILILLLSDVPLASLNGVSVEIRAFRVTTLTLTALCAAYATFGVLVLRYKATLMQRLVVSFGPAVLALALTIHGMMSPGIPDGFKGMKNEMMASSVASTVCVWFLAFVAYRFVSKNKDKHAT